MNRPLKNKSEDTVYTPEIDRQIIEGFLTDQETLLANMKKEDLSKEAIQKRAVELGLNKDFVELTKRGSSKPAARKCLRCDGYFASLGAQNRFCKKCH